LVVNSGDGINVPIKAVSATESERSLLLFYQSALPGGKLPLTIGGLDS
jgi:hypothetical protein